MDSAVVAVDVGGTFTDCVAWTPDGVTIAKLSSTRDQSRAVIEGTRKLAPSGAGSLLHGSTVATNALLERKGAETVLVTDPGFEDVIEIGRQDRPSLYDPFIDRPQPLVDRDRRLGETDPEAVAAWVAAMRPEAVAVSFAYSFADPEAEERVAAALADLDPEVSVSHRVAAEFREFERTSTTVLNAYLTPAVGGYLARLAASAEGLVGRVQVMRSSGGLMEIGQAAELASGLLLSGPAGGVVAAAEMGRRRGLQRIITFDMGGTSTDVCRIENGRPEVAYERTIDGYVCRMPSVAVHTVGAGGGSVAWVDPGGSLRVGPRSAGADPGPACYGRGGDEPTVTDAHLILGRIDPSNPLGGSLRLDPDAARSVMERLGSQLGFDATGLASGILEVVEAHMERAIRAVSVEQGADPREAALVAFGGAGGLHATSLARRLGISRVVIPPHAGVFSALGMLMAPPRVERARSVVGFGLDGMAREVEAISASTCGEYERLHGSPPDRVVLRVDLRYRGQSHEIPVPYEIGEPSDTVVERFHGLHRELNGFARRGDPVELVTVRAAAEGSPLLDWSNMPQVREGRPPDPSRKAIGSADQPVEVDIWWRPDLPAGMTFRGPALVEEEAGTTYFMEGDRVTVASDGALEVDVT